ncbi:MAG TPA: hypothetical protein VIE39_10635 [Thermoanaerobaculia bacterium]|jgi:hypothetical protein
MSFRAATLLALLPVVSGCYDDDCYDCGLYYYEEAYITEDVVDLMTNVFATAENAYQGDIVDPLDITQVPDATNDYTAVYLLPDAFRLGFGQGAGDVAVQITEDGLENIDPLLFSFAATTALTVEVIYDLRYLGMTMGARETDIALQVILTATRASPVEPFRYEYFVDGTCFFGTTFCDFSTRFEALGPPSAGIVAGFGDGAGFVDDPDVYDVFDLDVDWGTNHFRAQGDVGCCAYYDADFPYDQFVY